LNDEKDVVEESEDAEETDENMLRVLIDSDTGWESVV